MQYKLLTLALPTAAATNLKLRGGPASQSSVITSYNHGVKLPPPDKSCLVQLHSSECDGAKAKDGTECVWCNVPGSKHADEKGMCLSEFDVSKAMELMSFPCPNYEERLAAREQEKEVAEEAKAVNVDVSVALPDFSCFSQAWGGGDVDLCNSSKATDGSSCLWCTAADDMIEVGACLSPSQAGSASQFGLKCPSTIDETVESQVEEVVQDGLPDFNCFKAAWVAENAETACGQSSATDGSSCVWCQTKGDNMGACLSSVEAGMANGQFGLTCPSADAELEEEEEELAEEDEEDELEDELDAA